MKSKSLRKLRRATAFLLLLLLATSCQWVREDFDDETAYNGTPKYINITVSVSAGSNPVTRANPNGGEYGDGSEKGINREYLVNNIIIIFYQDENDPTTANTDINTASDNAKVVCVKKYAVRPYTDEDLPSDHTHKTGEDIYYQSREVLYTTGNQKLSETSLKVGQSYKALVVANVDFVDVKVGDKIKDIRDDVFTKIYDGNGLGINASNFVMSSESDASVTFSNPTIDTSNGENKIIYYFDCIHIERLAARIDYCTRGAEYDETYGGFVYNVGPDKFVVTKVTPFNLYKEPEYVFKRVRDTWADNQSPSINYLGDETTANNVASNYVVDPITAQKLNEQIVIASISYDNPLRDFFPGNPNPGGPVNPGNPDPGNPNEETNPFSQVMTEVYDESSYEDENHDNNIIIAYPRENTLRPNSLFKWYATGIVFEVDIYRGANAPNPPHGGVHKETKKYYHYLRHQGERAEAYKAEELKPDKFQNDRTACDNVPMKCGIVRNNIYRVSLSGAKDGSIILTIEEEKWRHVDNPVIYI